MESDLLDAEEVLAVRDALGNIPAVPVWIDGSDTPCQQYQGNSTRTTQRPARSLRTPVLDLEPGPAAVVVGRSAGRLGHVDRGGASMIDGRVEDEGELVASVHRDGLGPVADLPAHVATEVSRRQVRHRAVLQPVRVAIAADVLPGLVRGPADCELLEDVVTGRTVHGKRCSRGELELVLHLDPGGQHQR